MRRLARPFLALIVFSAVPATASTWDEVEALSRDQKFQEAETKALALVAAARGRDEVALVRGVIKTAQIKTALHGYENAVRFLQEEPSPKSPFAQALLSLSYGNALRTYARE